RGIEYLEPRIAGRRVPLDHDRRIRGARALLDRHQQGRVILEACYRWHEDVHMPVADLDGKRGLHHLARAGPVHPARACAAELIAPRQRALRRVRIVWSTAIDLLTETLGR